MQANIITIKLYASGHKLIICGSQERTFLLSLCHYDIKQWTSALWWLLLSFEASSAGSYLWNQNARVGLISQ